MLDYAPKKLRVIELADVKEIGLELNMRFRIKKIELIDIIEKVIIL
jgi:hypothetical protein